MFEKIKKLLKPNEDSYRPYNIIICKNDLHKNICDCDCHTTKGMLHIVDCCHEEKCKDCGKKLNVKA